MGTHSGLQRQVLGLYRRLLRIPRTKPTQYRAAFRSYIVDEFRAQAAQVGRKDIATVEYLVRRGVARAKVLENPGVESVSRRTP